MRITFEKNDKDFTLFFNMLSMNKVYADIAEKYDPDFSPPLSVNDYLVRIVGNIIQSNKFYITTLKNISDQMIQAMCSYMVGIGEFKLTNEIGFFGIDHAPDDYIVIDKDKLWDKLCNEGLEF